MVFWGYFWSIYGAPIETAHKSLQWRICVSSSSARLTSWILVNMTYWPAVQSPYSLLLGFKFEPILAQILENLTNFYFVVKNILRRGYHFTKIAKIQASRFHFQGEYPPSINSYTWVTMWSKTSLEEGPISQKLRENAHSIFHRPWYLGPSTLPILYYFVFDVYFVTLMNRSLII